MINIKDFKYTDAIDGKDIIWMNKPIGRETVQGVNTPPPINPIAKAFQVIPGIWVIPDRYVHQAPNFYDVLLSTDNDKTRFLKSISLLLKRIASTQYGEDLLNAISGGRPFYYNNQPQARTANIFAAQYDNPQANTPIKAIDVSVIIYGAGNNIDAPKSHFISTNITENGQDYGSDLRNGYGGISEIQMHPSMQYTFTKKRKPFVYMDSPDIPKDELFVVDPAMVLFHELIHSFHTLYGCLTLGIEDKNINRSILQNREQITLEEYVTYGALSPLELQDIQFYDPILTRGLDHIIDVMNTPGAVPDELKDVYKTKYFLDFSNGRYSQGRLQRTAYLNFLRKTFNEKQFAQKLNIPTREEYGIRLLQRESKFINLLDQNIYTITDGFTENLRKTLVGWDNFIFPQVCLHTAGSSTSGNHHITKRAAGEGCISINPLDYVYPFVEKYMILPIFDMQDPQEKIIYEEEAKNIQVNIKPKNTQKNFSVKVDDLTSSDTSKTIYSSQNQFDSLNFGWSTEQTSLYHIYKATKIGKNILSDITKPIEISYDNTANGILSAINDERKIYSFINFKEGFKNLEKSANVLNYAENISVIVDDFEKDVVSTDPVKFFGDTVQLVPILGPAFNIAYDIAKGDFKEAVKDTGIAAISFAKPILTVPIVLYSVVFQESSLKGRIKELFNIVQKSKDYVNPLYDEYFGKSFIKEWVKNEIYNMDIQLTILIKQLFNIRNVVIHNIFVYGKKHYKDLDQINSLAINMITNMNNSIATVRNNFIHMVKDLIQLSFMKYFTQTQDSNSIEIYKYYINSINEEFLQIKKDIAGEYVDLQPDYQKDIDKLEQSIKKIKENSTSEYNDYFQEHKDTIKDTVDIIIGEVIKEENIFQEVEDNIYIKDEISHICSDESRKTIDDIQRSSEIILGKDYKIPYDLGRNIGCIEINQDPENYYLISPQIKDSYNLLRSFHPDFAITFWIKPITKKLDKTDRFTIMETVDKKFGWVFRVENYTYVFKVLDKGKVIGSTPLGTYMELHNHYWKKISFTYSSKNGKVYVYINNHKAYEDPLYISKEFSINAYKLLLIQIHGKDIKSKHNFHMQDIKLFGKYLTHNDIKEEYKKDFLKQNHLYDIHGGVLHTDRNFIFQEMKLWATVDNYIRQPSTASIKINLTEECPIRFIPINEGSKEKEIIEQGELYIIQIYDYDEQKWVYMGPEENVINSNDSIYMKKTSSRHSQGYIKLFKLDQTDNDSRTTIVPVLCSDKGQALGILRKYYRFSIVTPRYYLVVDPLYVNQVNSSLHDKVLKLKSLKDIKDKGYCYTVRAVYPYNK